MMKAVSFLKSAVLALCAGSLAAEAAPRVDRIEAPSAVVTVQANCYAIGQQVAAQNGGTLARASLSNRGGRPVCVIVVVVPGRDGQRGRRQEFVVPAR